MRGVTLYKLLIASDCQTLLQLKLDLLKLKTSGLLFFIEDILTVAPDEPFEVYHSNTPGQISYRNAFPVEKNLIGNNTMQLQTLQREYSQYYNEEIDEDTIKLFQYSFIGQEYVWFYKEFGR